MPLPIEIWLIHPESEAIEAFSKRFDSLPSVRFIQTDYENLDAHDCFVTAANCYGIMNAGIDAAVIRVHGEELCTAIQNRILDEFLGEQPIGTAMIQTTQSSHNPFVCHAPTMRIPRTICGTDNVYRATFAALTSIYRYNVSHGHPIQTVALPAMGCGFGGMNFSESGRQMAAAYRHYLSPPHRLDWDNAIDRERVIRYDGKTEMIN